MNRHGMELSINFFVILIFTFVLFGMGMLLFSRIIGVQDDIKRGISSADRDNIQGYLSSGERIAMPISVVEMKRGETEYVGIGVQNVIPGSITYSISIIETDAFRSDKTKIDDFLDFLTPPSREISQNEFYIFEFPIEASISQEIGTYTYNLGIKYQGDEVYGNKTLIVKVS